PPPSALTDCVLPEPSVCVESIFLPFFASFFFAAGLLASVLPMLIDCELLMPDWLCEMFCAKPALVPPAIRAAAAAMVSTLVIAFPFDCAGFWPVCDYSTVTWSYLVVTEGT